MYKQVIAVRTDLKLGKGKLSAQVAHASLQAYLKASAAVRGEWESGGSKKVVVKVGSRKELFSLFSKARKAGLPSALIKDAGLTQIKAGTLTALGIGPAREGKLDLVTGKLKLL